MARYSENEIKILREGGKYLSIILQEVADKVRPGVTTSDLNACAEKKIRKIGGEPSFLGYSGIVGATPFSSTLCVSINYEVVHGPAFPVRTLQGGDIVGLDIGMRYPARNGFCTDTAMTVPVGEVSNDAKRLMQVARKSLSLGVAMALSGNVVRDVSRAIQDYVEEAGFSVVRELVGHGVGRKVHEDPEVPNFVVSGPVGDYKLRPGLVIAIEPMVNIGGAEVETLDDGWTIVSKDKKLSAHYEQTIVITKNGPEVLTPFL